MQWLTPFRDAFLWLGTLKTALFRTRNLIYLVIVAVSITLVAGILMFLIDPNIRTPLDGTWYAWVTMTHVGYGDVVPVSFLGRFVAALLILAGLALFALFTASVSAALIGRELGESARETASASGSDSEAAQVMRDVLAELTRLRQRLDELERRPGATTEAASSPSQMSASEIGIPSQ